MRTDQASPSMSAADSPVRAVQIDARVSSRGVDVQLEVPKGRVVAVMGPNGAGKSTILAMVSGLLRLDSGEVHLQERLVSSAEHHVAVHRRRVALLEQRPTLFEHLSVADNVAFGLRVTGTGRRDARAAALRQLGAVGCAGFADRRSWELSGGQAQRVALARALATDPEVVLLDEPLAALDVAAASAIRSLLRTLLDQDDRTALLVTHDVLDALVLADDLALVEGGRVTVYGPVDDVLNRPESGFLADLLDLNLLEGVAVAASSVRAGGTVITGVTQTDALEVGARATVTFTPAAVAVHLAAPGGSPRNQLAATVSAIESRGPLVRLTAALAPDPGGTIPRHLSADLTQSAVVALDLQIGQQVQLVVKAAQVTLFGR